MSTVVTGKVWKFGDDINTDFMAPSFSQNLEWDQRKKTILHIHHDFTEGFQEGDVIVAGSNFGCGSSRETAPANLKRLGVGCVIAESFGRIFFRNSIAIAFPVMACPGVSAAFDEGDTMSFDFDASAVRNETKDTELRGPPVPKELSDIVSAGGILELLKVSAAAGR